MSGREAVGTGPGYGGLDAWAVFRVLARQPMALRGLIVFVLLALLAWVDVATSPDISFLAFYFLPVLLASWYLGRGAGLATALVSVAIWTVDDFVARRHFAHIAVPIWNRSIQLSFFVFLSWLAGALKEALDREARARAERLERDLSLARDVQSALLPPRRQDLPGFRIVAECRQAFGVGGDAYEAAQLPSGGLAVVVADVSGKGISAALLMAAFLSSLRGLLPARPDRLDLLAEELSERLRTSSPGPRFVTAFIGILEDGQLRYVNAGHETGLVLPGSPGGAVRRLPSTATVLGLLPRSRFREERVSFSRGSSLLLFTDGLTECANAAGEEFGLDRVENAAVAAGADPDAIVARVLRACEAHAAGEPFADDVTIVCARSR